VAQWTGQRIHAPGSIHRPASTRGRRPRGAGREHAHQPLWRQEGSIHWQGGLGVGHTRPRAAHRRPAPGVTRCEREAHRCLATHPNATRVSPIALPQVVEIYDMGGRDRVGADTQSLFGGRRGAAEGRAGGVGTHMRCPPARPRAAGGQRGRAPLRRHAAGRRSATCRTS
jgi:hypothetical protein